MKNKALYITVRLDISYDEKELSWEEAKQNVLSECLYTFQASKDYNITTTDTEICGESEII